MVVARRTKIGVYLVCVGMVFLAAGEIAARVDDWMRWGFSPFSAVPDGQHALIYLDGPHKRGRPHGRFKQFALNSYGFRGPEIEKEPPSGKHRVMFLGASETFGEFQSNGKDYPAQITAILESRKDDRFEIVNGALPGLSCPTMRDYWTAWASTFHPNCVFIYPSTHLYLEQWEDGNAKPPAAEPLTEGAAHSNRFESRFKSRLREYKPAVMRRWQNRRFIESLLADKPPGWLFKAPPVDRLDALCSDLNTLIDAISASGARPVLMTHGISAADPPRPEDSVHLEEMRGYTLRATPEVLVGFEYEANNRIIKLARERGVPVIDLAAILNGKRELFVDLVHFNDSGAELVARVLADWLQKNVLPSKESTVHSLMTRRNSR